MTESDNIQEPTQTVSSGGKVPTITSQVKTKNPGRVAAGKRLAEISKAARERKKQQDNGEPRESLFTYQNIFPLVGIISIGAAALFYELRPKKATPPAPTS